MNDVLGWKDYICTVDYKGSLEVYALDPVSAAEKFVEDNYPNFEDYVYIVVRVFDPSTNVECLVLVDIEVMPHFHGILITVEE